MSQIRLNTNNLYFGIVFLQTSGGPHERSGGPHGCNQYSQLPGCLFPDFLAGPIVVGTPVSFAVELVRQKICFRMFAGKAIRFLYGAVGPKKIRSEADFGPHGPEDLAAFQTGRFRHRQMKPVPLDRANQGQSNPCIATGCLEHDLVMCQGS